MNDRKFAFMMTRHQAVAIGALASLFLEEAEEHGKWRRGQMPAPGSEEDKHFHDLEIALGVIEFNLGQKI